LEEGLAEPWKANPIRLRHLFILLEKYLENHIVAALAERRKIIAQIPIKKTKTVYTN